MLARSIFDIFIFIYYFFGVFQLFFMVFNLDRWVGIQAWCGVKLHGKMDAISKKDYITI